MAQAFLTTADQYSGRDVGRAVEEVNEAVDQVAASVGYDLCTGEVLRCGWDWF